MLPIIAVIITAVMSIFGIGAISTFIPMMGTYIWAAIFLLAAFFVPDFELYRSGTAKISLKSIFGMTAIFLIVVSLLGVNISNFLTGFMSLGSVTGSVTTQGITVPSQASMSGIVFIISVIAFYLLSEEGYFK